MCPGDTCRREQPKPEKCRAQPSDDERPRAGERSVAPRGKQFRTHARPEHDEHDPAIKSQWLWQQRAATGQYN